MSFYPSWPFHRIFLQTTVCGIFKFFREMIHLNGHVSNEPRDVTIGRRLSQPFSRSVRAHRSTPGSEQPGQGREGGAARRANVYAADAAVLVCLCPRIAVGSRLRSYDPLSSARDRESAPSKCAFTLVGGFGPATLVCGSRIRANLAVV